MEAELSVKGADMAYGVDLVHIPRQGELIVQANQVFLVEQVIWFLEINKVSIRVVKQEEGSQVLSGYL